MGRGCSSRQLPLARCWPYELSCFGGLPQTLGLCDRIDSPRLPPLLLVTHGVERAVVGCAEGQRPLVIEHQQTRQDYEVTSIPGQNQLHVLLLSFLHKDSHRCHGRSRRRTLQYFPGHRQSFLGIDVPQSRERPATNLLILVTDQFDNGLRRARISNPAKCLERLNAQVLMRFGQKHSKEDILLELPLTFSQAALGADVDVPTIHGSEAIAIPAGTQTGTRIRIRNKGVPRLNGGGKGDQIIFVTVVTPHKLNKEQRSLLEKLGDITRPPKVGERATGKEKSFFEKLFG